MSLTCDRVVNVVRPAWLRAGLYSAAVVLAGCGAPTGDTPTRAGKPPTSQQGVTRPAAQVSGWLNGTSSDDQLAGKVVVIDCFATWCGPCRQATPEVVRAYQKYHQQGVEFVALTTETLDEQAELEQFIAEYRVPWPIGYGADQPFQDLQVQYIPALFVFGADGQLVWTNKDSGDLSSALDRAVSASHSAQ